MNSQAVYIYALLCPRTGAVRYVGKTKHPKRRLREHLADSSKSSTKKARWICGLLKRNLKPELRVLEEVPVAMWEHRERHWIAHFAARGARLLNGTEGGDGMTTDTLRALWKNDDFRRKVGDGLRQGAARPGAKIKRAAASKEVWTREERREKHYAQISRLTENDVIAMRERCRAGETLAALAEEFGLSRASTSHAICGLTWGHVPGAFRMDDEEKRRRRRERFDDPELRARIAQQRREYWAQRRVSPADGPDHGA